MSVPNSRAAIVAAYAVMCLIWGTTWLGIKVSLHYVAPIAGAGLRFVIAGLVMYAFAIVNRLVALREARGDTGQRPSQPFSWKVVAVLATFMFGLNYILTYVAETRLDSGMVAVLFGTLPFFVFGFGHALAGERTTLRVWAGAGFALLGVAIISLAGQVRGSPLFAVAAILASLSASYANVFARKHASQPPLQTLPPAMLASGIFMTIAGAATEHVSWTQASSWPSLAALLYLAVPGSCLAFFINLWLLQRVEAWIVGLSALIIPVIAVIVGIAIGGESFTWRELLGSSLVVVGIWVALSQHEAAAEVA